MISRTTEQFWDNYARLPREIQRLADRCYAIWLADPSHPSIRFKLLTGSDGLHSARVGIHYRALVYRDGNTVVWVWIGHHSEYDRLIG